MKLRINNNKSKLRSAIYILVGSIIGLSPFISIPIANAAQITGRSVVLSTSVGDASGVTYTLNATALPTTTAVKSLEVKFCSSLTGACASPAGFSTTSSALASQPTGLGAASGWTASTATSGSLRILNAANSTASSGALTVVWSGVHNPTATNTAFYGVITTYSDSAWTTAIDSGSVALSTSSQIQVALTVDETLTFCTGTSITGEDCSTASGSIVNLGKGSTTATATGTSLMAASTNGNTGYSVTVNGTTLASGANTIDALSTGGASMLNTNQFGLNLASANTTPVIGSAKTGAGTASAAVNYGTNNNFRFASGEIIASAAGPTNANKFTIGYIANISGITPPGSYSTVLTYVATANF